MAMKKFFVVRARNHWLVLAFTLATCAELPPTIKHPSHRKHPLILLSNSPYGSDNLREVRQKFWTEEIEAADDQLVEQEIEHFSHPHHKLFMPLYYEKGATLALRAHFSSNDADIAVSG
ncbi:hypothetical protein HS088_TW04G01315 [Tripterygium wilfordii]|uniref:Uncharacterized protein n=1 Tax=Tripterygium wilfordii TaxID=458696 RepID=A0A7J7DSR0_TRIWF|nr:hypothetical protein HS088_TW04G01315 [Tripterygium wilfordii]